MFLMPTSLQPQNVSLLLSFTLQFNFLVTKENTLWQIFYSFFFRAAAKASTCRSSQSRPRLGDIRRGRRPVLRPQCGARSPRQEARPSAPEAVLHLISLRVPGPRLNILACRDSDHPVPLSHLRRIQSEQLPEPLLRQVKLGQEVRRCPLPRGLRVDLHPRPEEGLQLGCSHSDCKLQKLSPGAA